LSVSVKRLNNIAFQFVYTPQSYGTSLAVWITQCYMPPDTSDWLWRLPPKWPTVWVKKISPCGFLKFIPKQMGIF